VPNDDTLLERVVEELKRPVQIDATLDARIMEAIGRLPAPRGRPGALRAAARWFVRGRSVTLSPLAGLGIAAGIAVVALLGRGWLSTETAAPAPSIATAPRQAVQQFVIIAPGASRVALVGDFNDWNVGATPMRRADGNGIWSVTVPLAPGRYRYSFLVDGTRWVPDPTAPHAIDDDFGRTNSVVTVGGS
jgi:hypothetical protein